MTLLRCSLAGLSLGFALPARLPAASRDDTELAQHMEAIEDNVKALRRALRTAEDPAAPLELLAEIERLSLLCKGLTPQMAASLPEAERAAFVKAYRKTAIEFLMHQLEFESALLDGDPEAIKAAFDRFRAMEDSAHERFAPEDD